MKQLKKKTWCVILTVMMILSSFQPMTAKASENNVIQNAMPISPNGSYSGTAPERGEVFYRVDLQTSGKITFTLNVFQSGGASIYLYNNEYEHIGDKSVYYDGNRNCAYRKTLFHLCAGTYYIKIDCMAGAPYSFTTNFEDVKESFPESQSEPNDILGQAKTISLGKTYSGMIGYDDDQDFYSFTMPFSGNVTISHYNYTDNSSASYEILNEEGEREYVFYSYFDSNKGYAYGVRTYWLEQGTYYLKACGNNGFYKFTINVKPAAGAVDYGTRTKSKATLHLEKMEGVTGYIIQYSTSDKFSKKTTKSKTVKGTTAKLTGLKTSKVYYFRVKCYKNWNGKTYYSDYGDVYRLWP